MALHVVEVIQSEKGDTLIQLKKILVLLNYVCGLLDSLYGLHFEYVSSHQFAHVVDFQIDVISLLRGSFFGDYRYRCQVIGINIF